MSITFRYDEQKMIKTTAGNVASLPVLMDMWGQTFHILNRVNKSYAVLDPDIGATEFMEQEHLDIANQLDRNLGAFYKIEGFYDNPFTMLEMVRENRFTLQHPRLEVYGGKFGYGKYYDFSGDICEVSSRFYYRIYSPAFAARVREKALDRAIYPVEDVKFLAPVLIACPKCGGTSLQTRSPAGFALWAVICKCGHKSPVRQNDDLAAFAWNDGLVE